MNPTCLFWICTSQQKAGGVLTLCWQLKLDDRGCLETTNVSFSYVSIILYDIVRIKLTCQIEYWKFDIPYYHCVILWSVSINFRLKPNRITCFSKGFDIQMKGPDLLNHNGSQTRGRSDRFRTITQAAGSARTTDIYGLDPDSTYRFRVIPKAHTTEGEPSEVRRIGPGMSDY